jgi:predicted transposase/invertase (TIGR01784 family)
METDYLNRAQYYGSYSYVNQLQVGMMHGELLPVVVVSIIGNKCFPDDIPYISYHYLNESTTQQQYLFSLTYVFVELGKFDDSKLGGDAEQWLHLLKYAPKEQEPSKAISNKIVLSAYNDLEQFRWTPEEHDAYVRSRLAMEAEQLNYEEKYEKGLAEGKAEGEAKRSIEMAKEMLADNEPIEKIIKYTKLSKEEIEQLKSE